MSRRANFDGVLNHLGLIKSIQTYEITIASGTKEKTQTLTTAVNKTYAYAYKLGADRCNVAGYANDKYLSGVELTDGSTITVRTHANTAADVTCVVQVVEWHKWAVKDVQHGTLTIVNGQSSATAALSRALNINRSAVIYNGSTCSSTTQNRDHSAASIAWSSAGANITTTRTGTTNDLTVYYCAIEWRAGVVKSVQVASIAFSGNTQTATATISAVTTSKTMLFWGGCKNNAFQEDMTGAELTSSTQITATGGRVVTNNTRSCIVTAVEFKSKWVKSLQSDATNIAAGNETADATITAVNLGRTLIHPCGYWTTNAFSTVDHPTIYPTSTTNIRADRDHTSAFMSPTIPWRALEFFR